MDLSFIVIGAGIALIGWKLLSTRRSPAALADAARLLDEQGGVIVDVRTPAEFANNHAPGAVNVPAGSVKQHLDRLPAKDKPLLVHCASGTRSMLAVRELKAAGFQQVVDISTLGNALALPRGGSAGGS